MRNITSGKLATWSRLRLNRPFNPISRNFWLFLGRSSHPKCLQVCLNAPKLFIEAYKTTLATQKWVNVEPLIHANCCVTFPNGAVHKGISEIQKAYERNFAY